MSWRASSSRSRFAEYRKTLKESRELELRSWRGRDDTRPLKPRSRSFFQLFLAFVRLLEGHRGIVALAMLALTFSSLLSLVPMYGTKLVFDYALVGHPIPDYIHRYLPWFATPGRLLTLVAVGTVVIAGLSLLVGMSGRWQVTRISKRMQIVVRQKMFHHAVQLPLHRVQELKSGGMTSMLRDDAGSVADLLFSMIYNPWGAITRLLGTMAILAVVEWRLLLGSVLLVPVVYLTHRTWIRKIRPMFRAIRQSRSATDGHATEVFGGIRVVRGFGRQSSESTKFIRNNNLMARQELSAWWWMRSVEASWELLIPIATSVILWYGGMRIIHDMDQVKQGIIPQSQALTVGDLVMFMGYLMSLLGPLSSLMMSASTLQNALAGLDRVLDLFNEPTEVPSNPGAHEVIPEQVKGRIEMQNIRFLYPNTDKVVLENINLSISAGQVVALVGRSGAGKTTLCNLVARFYDPTQGVIRLDGTDLRDLELHSFRRLLGIVEQEVFLFDGTIAQNIAYGYRDADMDMVMAAARRANAHDFITGLAQGYNTVIGERGVKLSGGQRQRLSIARAILANPRILILDEATSNLDTESEQLIQAGLAELFAGRTTFVIAHRLSTVTHANLIVVLDKGRIVEQGTHRQLMEKGGLYFDMVERQRQFAVVTQAEEPQDKPVSAPDSPMAAS